MKYFYEKLDKDDFRIGYKVKQSVYSKKNKDSKIEIIENSLLGKIFILDGFVHLIEKNEFIFSEMMVHSVMFSHPTSDKVLIISDADRGILKEVIKHKSVNEIYLIEENREAYEALQNNFSNLEVKENSKIKIIYDNPIDYIKNFENYFDIIIIDTKNPNLKNRDFFKSVSKSLTKEGMMSLFSGDLNDSTNIKENIKLLKSIFRHSTLLRTPSNQILSDSGIILSSKKINISEINLRTLTTRFKQFKEAKNLKYYSPDIHLSSMIIPKFYNIK